MGCFDFVRPRSGGGGRAALLGTVPSGKAASSCFPRRREPSGQANGAASEAADALQDIVLGYQKLAQLALPPGAALVFANLYRVIVDLEGLVNDVQLPKSRPWMLPLPEEQQDWEAVYPQGGFLLRRQVCMASTGDEEWFLGGLFISDAGIVFDTGSGPDDCECFDTGLLPWNKITSLERPGPKTELDVKFISSSRRLMELKLQLSIACDIEWVEEFWKLRHAFSAHDHSVPEEDAETIHVPISSTKPRLLLPALGTDVMTSVPSILSPRKGTDASTRSDTLLRRKLSRGMSSAMVSDLYGGGSPGGTSTSLHFRTATLESNVSGTFIDAPQGRKVVQLPQDKPSCEERIDTFSVDQLHVALRCDDCIPKVVIRGRKAEDVSMTKWKESQRSPGVFVKKATFRIPLPQDFPKAVTRLVAVPTETKITAVYRLRMQGDEMIMTLQTCSHDVPYGENFRVHETLLFKALPTGGVVIDKWVEIMWVAALPWTHGVLKSIIESRTKADAAADLGNLVSVLKEAAK